jgi:tRNA(fMet)-specific endonuclease VapC
VKYLLDTNICVFVIRQKPQGVMHRFRQHDPDDLGISTVTLAELRYGADKSQDPVKNHNALNAFLAPLEIADFDARASEAYGKVRQDLESRGLPIGPLDTMIAAHALSLNVAVVTNNANEFSRVTGLTVEDWTQPSQ